MSLLRFQTGYWDDEDMKFRYKEIFEKFLEKF